ncbi:MAG: NYN domain-containing protein [Firmicutes bacterium]|nr:NYN domain-containing protein [Bacillota bacterium]
MWKKEDDIKLAVLIDAENISAKYAGQLFNEIAQLGEATVRRVYGDWSADQMRSWRSVLEDYAISTRQEYCFAKGKNSSDSAMIIDAMDLLYSDCVDGFCIVSSDSDFTNLARRLREAGKLVLGAGESKTPKAFANSCNRFIYVDLLARSQPQPAAPAARRAAVSQVTEAEKSGPTDQALIREDIVRYLEENADDKVYLSSVSDYLRKLYPDFDVRNYGCSTFKKFINTFDAFEIERVVGLDPSQASDYIRIKAPAPAEESAAKPAARNRKRSVRSRRTTGE